MTPVLWPVPLRRVQGWSDGYDPQAASGGRQALSGRLGNVHAPGRGIWRPYYLDVPVWTRPAREALLVMEGLILGRDAPILVPYHHRGFGPFLADRATSTFDDGSAYGNGSLIAPRTVALVRRAAEAGEVMVRITKTDCGAIRAGHAFSIDGHLHRVRSVETQNAGWAEVEIYPELRADVLVDDWVEFDRPVVKSRLLDPRALAAEWGAASNAMISVQFIEDTTP
ncbi:hypothetical protein ATO13_08496 [Stappia sp. 22II-S9-Z10]|nr:hypothetical protein ATO13_08496 [Stappia sp. 22II-S9-Z10]